VVDTVPQSSPAMMVGTVSIAVDVPHDKLFHRHAAVSGSTPTTLVNLPC